MWDGIILGGGLAGLMAGIRGAERGQRILIISEGVGSLAHSSGALDIGDVGQLQCQEQHPYALLGEPVIRAGVEYFQTHFPEYKGEWRQHRSVFTPLGSRKRSALVPSGLSTETLQKARQMVLVIPEGMKDFYPEVIKANLERIYPQCTVEYYPLRVDAFAAWQVIGKPVTGMDYARYWRSETGMMELERVLSGLAQHFGQGGQEQRENRKTAVVFPGLVTVFSKHLKDILAGMPFPVIEMTTFPPSASGQFLYEALKQKFKSLGGEILIGSRVKHAEILGKRCQAVTVQSKGRDTVFSARSFVLATGGIFGGGIVVSPKAARETVFDLPLYVPEEWTHPAFLGDQPYARMGIVVDHELRPIDPQSQNVLLENVRVAGRMLAHWDPWTEHCGGGVSLASGWFAGEKL